RTVQRAYCPLMGGWRGRWLAAVGAAALSLPLHAQTPDSAPPLRLAAPVRPAKDAASVYIVKLRQPGAASYKGGIAGFAATKPSPGRKLDSTDGAVQSYVNYLESAHDRMLSSVGAGSGKLYSFRYALNGFAARLTPEQAVRLAQ